MPLSARPCCFGRVAFAIEEIPQVASCAIRCADPISGVAPGQKPQNLGQDLSGLAGQFRGTDAGQRVGDEGKGIVRSTVSLGDGLRIGHEEFGTDGCGRDATPLQEDSVEHTAR